jgi:hypothetical protein
VRKCLVIDYKITVEEDGGFVSMINKIDGVSLMVDLEYSSGSTKNLVYKDIEVEPEENEI